MESWQIANPYLFLSNLMFRLFIQSIKRILKTLLSIKTMDSNYEKIEIYENSLFRTSG